MTAATFARPRRLDTARSLAVLAALALLSLPALARAEKVRLEGGKVAIHNLIGECRVVPGATDAVEVEIEIKGKDARVVKIETGPVKGRAAVRVVYAGDQFVYPKMGAGSTTQVRVNADGTFGGDQGPGARKVTVRGRGAGLEAWADITVRMPKGRDVEVRLGVGEAGSEGTEGTLAFDSASGPVNAARHRGSLSVDTGSGAVEVREAAGDVSIDTGSGTVTVADVQGGSLRVDTGSGAVQGARLRATNLQVDTGSGAIQLEGVQASTLRLDTGSGGVSLGLEADVEDAVIDTGSGGVTVRLPRSLGAMLEADTGSGAIQLEAEASEIRKGHGELTARLGDGAGKLRIDTGSGSVRVVQR